MLKKGYYNKDVTAKTHVVPSLMFRWGKSWDVYAQMHNIFLTSCILAAFPEVSLSLSLPPPAASATGGEPDIRRAGAGQTEAWAPSLLQPQPLNLQPRHCVRSDPLPGETAVNSAALDEWMSLHLLVRAEIQSPKLKSTSKGLYLWTVSVAFSISFGHKHATTSAGKRDRGLASVRSLQCLVLTMLLLCWCCLLASPACVPDVCSFRNALTVNCCCTNPGDYVAIYCNATRHCNT